MECAHLEELELIKWLKNIFKEKPVYHITISKVTGDEEQCSLQFNGYSYEGKDKIVSKLELYGGALHERVVSNNFRMLEVEASMTPNKPEKRFKSTEFPDEVSENGDKSEARHLTPTIEG